MAEYVELVGAKELMAKLAQMPGRGMSIIKGALNECCEEVRSEVIPVTPKSRGGGNLRNSVKNYGVEIAGTVATGTVGAGGAGIKYARRVHELPEDSNWSEPGTGPKYLERPAKAYKLGVRMAAKLRGRLERALAGK